MKKRPHADNRGNQLKQTSACEAATHNGLSLPAGTTGHILTSMRECVCVRVTLEGVGWGEDERQPCTVISKDLRLKMTLRLGGLWLCAAC